jgi:D-glycero-D-manno-heptose 1,7-bisphosphate phosphatase
MTKPKVSRPAVFLDRDGTLIEDVGYLSDPSQVRVYRGAVPALRALRAAGYLLFIVTNQSGVARGYFPESAVKKVHRSIQERLKLKGARIDGFYYCPHYPGAIVKAYSKVCPCRKPKPGMVRQALKAFSVDLKKSYMVGDKLDDLHLASRAGLAGAYLVRTGNGRRSERELKKLKEKFPVVQGLARAAAAILSQKARVK